MKRFLAVGSALGFAGAGLMAFANPGSAGVPPSEPTPNIVQLEAVVTPADLEVGDSFTITPSEGCTVRDAEDPGTLHYWLFSYTTGEELEGDLAVAEDGTWELALEADVVEEVNFYAQCWDPDVAERVELCFPKTPQDPAVELKSLNEETTETTEDTTTTTEATTTTTVEPPADCLFEEYDVDFEVGDAPPPAAPRPPRPIPGTPPLTG